MTKPPLRIIREGEAPPSEGRPQDPHLDGRDLTFETLEHGGAEPDTMPNAIRVTDPEGRTALYVLQRAVNAHDDMLAALKEMVIWMPSGFAPQSKTRAMQMALAAIAKAEGRDPTPPSD